MRIQKYGACFALFSPTSFNIGAFDAHMTMVMEKKKSEACWGERERGSDFLRAPTSDVGYVPNAKYLAHIPHQIPFNPFIRCSKCHIFCNMLQYHCKFATVQNQNGISFNNFLFSFLSPLSSLYSFLFSLTSVLSHRFSLYYKLLILIRHR